MIQFLLSSKMNKEKQVNEMQFQNFLAQKYCKQFHIVDNPVLSFSLAKKSFTKELNWNNNSNIDLSLKGSRIFNTQKQKSNTRQFYDNLKNHAASMIESIYKCLDKGKFALSQFFQYQQLVLAGFMKGFTQQLKSQCRQKGQFLQFLWNQNIKLVYKMLNFYQRADYKQQVAKNLQLHQTHLKYSNFMSQQSQKIKQKNKQIQNLKQIIQILVQKLRIRRKEVKKLFKETQQLILIVNQFKDKNTELQFKFLSLIQPQNELNQTQRKQILEKKQRLNNVYSQILTIQNAIYKNASSIHQEVNIQGPFQISDFIKEAAQAIHSTATNQQIKGQIEVILGRVQEDFEDTLLRIKKVTKKRLLHYDSNLENVCKNFRYQIQRPKPDTQPACTQFSFNQKKDNDIVKNRGVQVGTQAKKIITFKNQSTQYNYPLFKYKSFNIYSTVDCKIINQSLKNRELRPSLKFSGFKKQRNSIKQSIVQQIGNEQQEDYDEQILIKNSKIITKKKLERKEVKSRFSMLQNNFRKNSSFIKKQIRKSTIQQINEEKYYNKQIQKQNKRSLSANFSLKKDRKQSAKDFIQKNQELKSNKNKSLSILRNKRNSQIDNDGQNYQSKKTNNTFSRFSRLNHLKEIQNLQIQQNNDKRANLTMKVYQNVDKITNKEIREIFQIFDEDQRLSSYNCRNNNLNYKALSLKQRQDYLPGGFVGQFIEKALQRKAYSTIKPKQLEHQNQLRIKSKQMKWQVTKIMKSYNLKKKKLSIHTKKSYLWNIIESVYARAYQKIQQNNLINFIQPLYQQLLVLYGSLSKQEIKKKMTNLIAQICYFKKDQICKSFIFFLMMDDDDKICQNVTSYDINLYLKLIKNLDNFQKKFQDISKLVTDYQKLEQVLPKFFNQQNLSKRIAQVILQKILKYLKQDKQQKFQGQQYFMNQKKMNLFYCSKTIIKQIILTRIYLKNSFLPFLFKLNGLKEDYQKQNEAMTIQESNIHRMIRLLCKNKINQLQYMDRIHKIRRSNNKYLTLNQFSWAMMSLQLESLQDFYIKVLNKFQINREDKRNYLIKEKLDVESFLQNSSIEYIQDLFALQLVQKRSNLILEQIIGYELTQLTSLIVLIISEI